MSLSLFGSSPVCWSLWKLHLRLYWPWSHVPLPHVRTLLTRAVVPLGASPTVPVPVFACIPLGPFGTPLTRFVAPHGAPLNARVCSHASPRRTRRTRHTFCRPLGRFTEGSSGGDRMRLLHTCRHSHHPFRGVIPSSTEGARGGACMRPPDPLRHTSHTFLGLMGFCGAGDSTFKARGGCLSILASGSRFRAPRPPQTDPG